MNTAQEEARQRVEATLASVRAELAVAHDQIIGKVDVIRGLRRDFAIAAAARDRFRAQQLRQERGRLAAEHDLARANARAEHLRKYAGHHENCPASFPVTAAVGYPQPCACGFYEGLTEKADPEDWTDDSNRASYKQLDGRSVTIQAHANDDQVTDGMIGPSAVADAILEEYGVRVSYFQVDFHPRQELGVWDAKVRFGGHAASVKVWIVRAESEPTTPDAVTREDIRQVWEAIHTVVACDLDVEIEKEEEEERLQSIERLAARQIKRLSK